MFLYPVDFLDYVAPGNEAQAVPKPDESKSKEGNEDEKRCLEDMQKTLTCAPVLVERLCYAKKGERHGRKLKQSQADQGLGLGLGGEEGSEVSREVSEEGSEEVS